MALNASNINNLEQPALKGLNLLLLICFTYTLCLWGKLPLGVSYPQGYLELYDPYEQNSSGYTYVFEVELFNCVVDDVTGSHVIPKIDMAAAQTGSNTISAHRTDRNKIPTATSMF